MRWAFPCKRSPASTAFSDKTVYLWKRKYNGVSPSELKRLKELERENGQLKKLVAELSLDKEILQDVLRKKL